MATTCPRCRHGLPTPTNHPIEIEAEAWKSGYPPLPRHIQSELRSVRKNCDASLQEIQEEVIYLESRLRNLQEQREHMRTRIAKLDSAVAPHKALPPELLSWIFELANDGAMVVCPTGKWFEDVHTTIVGAPDVKHTYPELVCALWREVAISTPSLWRAIAIGYCKPALHATTTNGVLSLGGRGSTDLFIKFDDTQSGEVHIEKILPPFRSRLKRVEIYNTLLTSTFLESTLSALHSSRQLEELKVVHPTFGFLPTLRDVIGGGFLTGLATTHLRKLIINHSFVFPVNDVATILHQSKCLEVCLISIFSDDSAFCMLPNSIVLDSLRELSIRAKGDWSRTLSPLLRALSTPALTKMTLYNEDPRATSEDIASFITTSGCSLESLAVGTANTPLNGIDNLLSALPTSIKKLLVPNFILSADYLREIAEGQRLVQLKHIKCAVVLRSDTMDVLEDLLRKRAPLSFFHFVNSNDVFLPTIFNGVARLQAQYEQGFSIGHYPAPISGLLR